MKTIVSTLCAMLALTPTASAAPMLTVKIVIVDHGEPLGHQIIPNKSGQPVTVQFGQTEYVFTPTLLITGQVKLDTVVREHVGDAVQDVVKPRTITVNLGRSLEVQAGDVAFQTTFTLDK